MLQEEDRIRTIAGFLLKNNARYILQAPPEVAEFVKVAVLQAFNDPSIMIRNAASQDIVTFLGVLEPKNWPECLQQLVNALDSADLDKQEVSELIHFLLVVVGGGIPAWMAWLTMCCPRIHRRYHRVAFSLSIPLISFLNC